MRASLYVRGAGSDCRAVVAVAHEDTSTDVSSALTDCRAVVSVVHEDTSADVSSTLTDCRAVVSVVHEDTSADVCAECQLLRSDWLKLVRVSCNPEPSVHLS